jgi:hypothetical protein
MSNTPTKATGCGIASILALVSAVILIGIWWFTSNISYRNQEVALRSKFNATQSSNKVNYDAMWKIISGVAEVPQQYSQDFKDAYSSILASGSNTSNNSIRGLFATAAGMKVPELNPSLYAKVQNVIEAERTKFANNQRELLDIKREHDKLCQSFPGSLFLGGVTPLEAKLVTSTRTEKSFDTGVDDDASVFKK